MNKQKTSRVTQHAQDIRPSGEPLSPSSDLFEYFRQYAREKPEVVALWCLGIGVVVGWKLKIW